jgi:hypothetical protein
MKFHIYINKGPSLVRNLTVYGFRRNPPRAPVDVLTTSLAVDLTPEANQRRFGISTDDGRFFVQLIQDATPHGRVERHRGVVVRHRLT